MKIYAKIGVTCIAILLGMCGITAAQDKTPTPNASPKIVSPNVISTASIAQLSLPQIASPNASPTAPIPVVIPQKVDLYTYLSPVKDGFMYPPVSLKKYPDLDISGFYETKISGRNFNPKIPSDSRYQVILNDPIYNKLPRDVLLGDPRLDIRYRFNIDGKLDKDLTVHYDIEQEPDFPGKYDIKIKYKTTNLTFYHFDVDFNDSEFMSVRKALNGAMVQSYGDEWETTIATGKQRSQATKYAAYGNGSTKISLGNRSILEDSLKVWVNNSLQVIGRDYTVNYFQGEVTFTSTKGSNDYIVAVYEYTNPIEDFIPLLSRRNFLGAQFLWRPQYKAKEIKYTKIVPEEILKPAGSTPNYEINLRFSPVLLGTEYVKINGRLLRQDKDYSLKNQRGKLYILNPALLQKGDQLTIAYEYYDTDAVEEDIIAKNSPGPYTFSRKYVQDGSLSVNVDNVSMIEGKDYSMEYEKGRLLFNYEIKYPKVISVKYTAVKSRQETVTKNNAPFTAGVTYLSEYAQTQLENQVLTVPTESYTLTTSNVITVKQSPIVNTSNIKIIINNVKLNPTQYAVTNAYLGQITVSSSVGATKVSYSYQKSFRTTFVFDGKDGRGRLPYINNTDFTLRDVPVARGGVAYIRLFSSAGETLLSPGREFEVNYGTDGQAIQISFRLKNDAGFAASQLADYPKGGDRITLVYDYTPPPSPAQGNVDQKVIGFTLGAKINDQWRLGSEIVVADNNLSKPQSSTSTELSGTGQANASYDLGNKNIVENSEEVYLDLKRVNKDNDYVINYALGTVRFINLNPGTTNKIQVKYRIYDAGSTQLGEKRNTKLATKFTTQYTTTDVTLKGDFKFIDKDFLPIGDLREAVGSTVYGGSMDWKVDPQNLVNMDYHHRDIYRGGSAATNQALYLRTDEVMSLFDLKNIYGAIDTKQSIRMLKEIQDPNTTSTRDVHGVDDVTWDYNGSMSFGPNYFKTSLLRGLSRKETNVLDIFGKAVIETEKTRVDNQTLLSKLYAVGDSSFTSFFEFSQSKQDQHPTVNLLAAHEISYGKRTAYGVSSTFLPYAFLPLKIDFNRDEVRSRTAKQPTESVNTLTNAIYDLTYNPTSWFNSNVVVRHTESESPLANQKGALEDNRNYQVGRFTPIGFLGQLGINESSWFLSPIRSMTMSYGINEFNRRENNNAVRTDFNSNRFSISNIEPIDGFVLKTYNFDTSLSTRLSLEGSSVASQNTTLSSSRGQSAGIGITPRWPLLNLFTYSINLDDRTGSTQEDNQARSITSNRVTSRTPYFKRSQQLNFEPGDIGIQLPFLPKIGLGRVSTVLTETFDDKQNYRLSERYMFLTGDVPTWSVAQDNSRLKSYGLSISLTPMYVMNLSGTAKLGSEWYNRNINTTARGSTFKDTLDLAARADMSPFSFLKLDSSASYSLTDQYRSSALDTSLDFLKNTVNSQTYAQPFLDFLTIKQYNVHGGVTLIPFSFLSLSSGADYNRIQQSFSTSNNGVKTVINQVIGSAGVSLMPFTGFSTAFTYSLKFSNDGTGADSKGYAGVTTITYVPFQTQGFKVNITYTREDTWGRDLNVIDRSAILNGSGAATGYQIVERQDTVETAVLGVDINIPITNNPFINSFVVTGEGHVKRVTDGLDYTKRDKRSYDISGLVLKGTLLF
jgi:hypothetical protein